MKTVAEASIHERASPRVLFFAQKRCNYAEQVRTLLVHLGFDVETVWSVNRGEELPEHIRWWEGEYILCFRSYFLLPTFLLDKARIAAINVHPGPTEYPGSGCINWALYEGAREYGVTAHIMNEKIDNGAVIECRRFPIFPQDDVTTLLTRAHQKAFDMIVDLVSGIRIGGKAFLNAKLEHSKDISWRGRAKKMIEIDKLQVISPACSANELARIVRATDTPQFPCYIELHGRRFFLERNDDKVSKTN